MDPQLIPLRDLHLPAGIGWWPPAPGWWILAGLALLATLWVLRYAYAKRRRSAARRLALRELARLRKAYDKNGNAAVLGIRLSLLLRRAMLAYAPRNEVAGLTGDEWLLWLDRGLAGNPFTDGPGRNLRELPYRRPGGNPEPDIEGLLAAVSRRLQTPLPEAG